MFRRWSHNRKDFGTFSRELSPADRSSDITDFGVTIFARLEANVDSQETTSKRGLFLDRDGIINEEIGYLSEPADVRFMSGIFSLCRTAQRLGYILMVVTNQSGIARGYYSEADFHRLMDWMRAEFAREGVTLDAVYFCPFHPQHGIGEYRQEHEDRKPGAGMLRRGGLEFSLDLTKSIMVGDRCSDVAAANSAGLRQAFLLKGTESSSCTGSYIEAKTLMEIEQWLVQWG